MYRVRTSPRTPESSVEAINSSVAENAVWLCDSRSHAQRPPAFAVDGTGFNSFTTAKKASSRETSCQPILSVGAIGTQTPDPHPRHGEASDAQMSFSHNRAES